MYSCIPWYFPVTGTLSFVTLYSPSTLTSGDENYGGFLLTRTGFMFGNDYVYSIFVSAVQNIKDTFVQGTICCLKF